MMTAADLLPGDIILWNNRRAMVEAIALDKPFGVKVKLNTELTTHFWDDKMLIVYIGTIEAAKQVVDISQALTPQAGG